MVGKMKDLGELTQLAFVPQDFDAALQHWITMGAGPFFLIRNAKVDWCRAYGREVDIVHDIAVGNWGQMQIELIRQISGGKSVYSDWFDAKKEGVHHTCIVVDDMRRAKKICRESGCDIVHEGGFGEAEWIYVDTHGGDGTMLEIFYQPGAVGSELMALTKAAALGWDGSDPIREISFG